MKSKKFDYVVGVGGIGTGILFKFDDNRTLGRDESRLAELSDIKDYCKLHIILHYVAVLGPKIPIYAIGRVGNDSAGYNIISMMKETGINTDYVKICEEIPTLYSVCYIYPDSDGGNITASNSASQYVSCTDIDEFFNNQSKEKNGLVLAAPEVPLKTRLHLLKCGREFECFNTASFTSSEILNNSKNDFDMEILKDIDFLSINKNEMKAFLEIFGYGKDEDPAMCYEGIKRYNPNIQLVVTLGRKGACVFYHDQQIKAPAIWKRALNSAGAGDCYMGTILSAFLYGVPLFDEETGVGLSGLAALVSSMKVECKDTIYTDITKELIHKEAQKYGFQFTKQIQDNFFRW